MPRRRLLIPTILLLLSLLTACQKAPNPFLGTWYGLYNYDTFTISQTGDSLLFTYKGQDFPVNTQQDVPTVTLSILGTFPLVINEDKSLIKLAKTDFTQDQALAANSYEQAAQSYARALVGELYKLEMTSMIDFFQNKNCKGQYFEAYAGSSVLGCVYSWNRENRDATITMQLPFGKTLSFTSEQLFSADDNAVLAGKWSFRNNEGEALLNLYGGVSSPNTVLGTVEYTGQYQCHAELQLVRRNGYAFRVQPQQVTGTACPELPSEFWISAQKAKDIQDKYSFIAAELPVPRPAQFGLTMSGNQLGKGFGYVGSADPPLTVGQEPVPGASTSATPSSTETISEGATATEVTAPTATTPAASTQPTSPPFALIRPLADPVAAGLPRLYDLATTLNGGDGSRCALIDPGNPIKRCRVTVSSTGQYAWGSSWCTANAQTLARVLKHISFRYEIDGQPLDTSQFWQGRSNTCLKRRLIVQNMRGGDQHEFKLVIQFDQTIQDGESRYPAGNYELLLEVDGS